MAQRIWTRTRLASVVTALPLAVGVALAPLPLAFGATSATAAEESESARKAKWQERYRSFLTRLERMHADRERLEQSLASVQHAKHPRGAARHQFQQQIEARDREIAQLESQIAEFQEEAHRASVPPGWLTEVEDRQSERSAPAAYDDEESEDDTGRNPIHQRDRDRADDDDEEEEEEEEDDDRSYKSRRLD